MTVHSDTPPYALDVPSSVIRLWYRGLGVTIPRPKISCRRAERLGYVAEKVSRVRLSVDGLRSVLSNSIEASKGSRSS